MSKSIQWVLGVMNGVYQKFFFVPIPDTLYQGRLKVHKDGSLSVDYDNPEVKAQLKRHAEMLGKTKQGA